MNRKSYRVSYRDDQSVRHEVSTYAKDSFDAKLLAMKSVEYLSEHPNAIDNISLCET